MRKKCDTRIVASWVAYWCLYYGFATATSELRVPNNNEVDKRFGTTPGPKVMVLHLIAWPVTATLFGILSRNKVDLSSIENYELMLPLPMITIHNLCTNDFHYF